MALAGVVVHFRYYKTQSHYCLAWSCHATNRVKLNPQVFSVQLQIPAKFYPDQLTYGRMVAEKYVFDLG